MLTKDLHAISKYLYGEGWQTPLAKELDVNLRTVQRWAAGDVTAKESVADEIYQLVAARQLQELLPVLETTSKKHGGLPEIELKISGSDRKVTSIHKRAWSSDADRRIKTWLARFLNDAGISAEVTD